jgi:hypothetical protein
VEEGKRGAPRFGLWAKASALGVLFPSLIVAGYFLGKWLGAWLGLGGWTALVGAGLGVVGGFINLFRWVVRDRP